MPTEANTFARQKIPLFLVSYRRKDDPPAILEEERFAAQMQHRIYEMPGAEGRVSDWF